MTKRKLLIGLVSAGAFTAGFGAAVFPATAQLRTITVTLVGVPERAERTLTRLDVAAVGAPVRGLRPTRVSIALFGPPAVVQSIDPEQVVPFVDATAVARTRAPGLARVQVRGLPEGVEARRIAPPEVLVTPAP